jgi:DNA-directed RNA polymerase specialized sigma24 family protein
VVNQRPISGETCPSGVEDPAVQNILLRIVVHLERNPSSREDLMQEGLVHYWLEVGRHPGRSRSWYLQSCQYHIRHYLAAGRSVDSPKRGPAALSIMLESDDPEEPFATRECDGGVLSEVSAHEIIALLSSRLGPRTRAILGCLIEEMGICEIARKLNVSHPAVIKQRRKIASVATGLGIAQ